MSLWGEHNCPKWEILSSFVFFCRQGRQTLLTKKSDSAVHTFVESQKPRKLGSHQRIGPHNYDVLCLFYGALMGDAYAEKRAGSTRICFQQESSNAEYLGWLHRFLSEKGYCNEKKPKLQKRIGKGGKIRFLMRFKTWSFQSLNWIHDDFYKQNTKVVPSSLEKFLSPLALAVWIMDDGGECGAGFKIATNAFPHDMLCPVVQFLRDRYQIKASIVRHGGREQDRVLYIWAASLDRRRNIVEPYIVPSMRYKLFQTKKKIL